MHIKRYFNIETVMNGISQVAIFLVMCVFILRTYIHVHVGILLCTVCLLV